MVARSIIMLGHSRHYNRVADSTKVKWRIPWQWPSKIGLLAGRIKHSMRSLGGMEFRYRKKICRNRWAERYSSHAIGMKVSGLFSIKAKNIENTFYKILVSWMIEMPWTHVKLSHYTPSEVRSVHRTKLKKYIRFWRIARVMESATWDLFMGVSPMI